jgi:thiamine pyrophosphate-dependent acetolactate synthase large subunit-like protein
MNRSSTTAINKGPELLTCLHEESSVGMAHGYAKIEGKPMMIMAHGTVGLQHASMAIYNAYTFVSPPARCRHTRRRFCRIKN